MKDKKLRNLGNQIIAVDIDGTLTNEIEGWDYVNRTPQKTVISLINFLYREGYYIKLFSSRYDEDRGVTEQWLSDNGVKYNELLLDKPKYDFILDDKSI